MKRVKLKRKVISIQKKKSKKKSSGFIVNVDHILSIDVPQLLCNALWISPLDQSITKG